jgi:23S rRNA pseudouridine1911/1915/1917 synthase
VRRETLVVDCDALGQRLDRFIVDQLEGVSRKSVKRALDGGQVFIDGRSERRANLLLKGGETLTLTIEGEVSRPAPAELEILYRDEQLLAVNKPAGLPAHPTEDGRGNALDLVRQHCPGLAPILLHRLDGNTTGVLLFALTAEANRELARQFAERLVVKTYLALVAGSPADQFAVNNFLKSGVRGRTVAVGKGGDRAETAFRTLATGAGFALIEARPKTGRTHQIRAHLAGEGYPLLGDTLYGGPVSISMDKHLLHIRRHLLHALQLVVQHPKSQKSLCLSAPLPADFQMLWPGLISTPVC